MVTDGSRVGAAQVVDRILYVFSWVIVGCVLVLFVLQVSGVFTLTDDLRYPCGFRLATGLFCPGCGGSHALTALLGGRIFDSILAHPFVPYIITLCLIKTIRGTHQRLRHLDPPPFRPIFLYIGIIILIGQWIVKNALLLLG